MGTTQAKTRPVAGRGSAFDAAIGELTSERLAWQAGRGCQASFAELVRRFAPRLQAFLRRRTRDRHEAEDIVQDTFLRVYEHLDQYDSSRRFSTWLFTIAARAAISHHRRRRVECRSEDLHVPACDLAAEEREQRQNLWTTAAQLPETQRQALWLRYAEELPIQEIARVMGKSQVCVKVLLYRARVNMAKLLEDREP